MGQGTILSRLANYDSLVKTKITKEEIDEILGSTFYNENEIFQMLDRFIDLNPEKQSYCISINKLKKLREFEHNPFCDLILNSIDIYKKIYVYLSSKNSDLRKIFEKKEKGLEKIDEGSEGEEEELEDEDEEEEENDDDQKDEGVSRDPINDNDKMSKLPIGEIEEEYFLTLENKENEKNTTEVINFNLFCKILNELHLKVSQEDKFKMAFRIFDVNCDSSVDLEDLKKVYKIIFKGYVSQDPQKELNIENLAKNILLEFSTDPNYKIDFNNFQKIILSSNFLNNLVLIP